MNASFASFASSAMAAGSILWIDLCEPSAMPEPHEPYSPINCEFHDVLEATATRRSVAQIRFVDEHGRAQARSAKIINLFARDGAEYLELDSGERIRLDRLLTIDGQRLADYGAAE